MQTQKQIVVIPRTTRRDIFIGVGVGVLALALLAFAIVSMSGKIADVGLTGKIVAKHFTPQAEEQIAIGRGGLRERHLDGEYTFDVYVESEQKTYTVWVNKTIYDTHQPGESFYFLRPPGEH